ncbi:TetR/AcrR family transcriptional regulator [Cryptosporangium aurantiacum]|uniref:Transcriptional regulator, TetR family n=1 Tax=Cryptosporangium aurantiacum TaxID=134849 RepID=A0A1M7RP55_9ACTN|nr:TetR/AcrR family transcriptional regulator [Cryptosporangium aurantiacum]SHN48127.1 transcriptional regulator, TetR family [Cryptosporangium aurantiacum]
MSGDEAPMSGDEAPISGEEATYVTIEQRPSGLVTWRQRKKQATREALADAAWRLATEVGPENVRVDDIAAAAGVSPRTFNNYFSSREEAICAQRLQWAHLFAAALRRRPADEALDAALLAAVLEVRGVTEPEKAMIRLIAATPAMQAEYLRHSVTTEFTLAEAIVERTGCDPLTGRVVGGAYATAIRAASEYWLRDDGDLPLTEFLRAALDRVAPAARALQASAPGRSPETPLREGQKC